MTIARWNPPVAPTRQEAFLLKRLDRVRKLLGFLRLHRHTLFDAGCQEELASMYRSTGAGRDALPPAMLAMATLVQGYLGVSDAEMVELTIVDLRVQMVLGCLGAEKPAFSQGTLQEFRERLIAADLDRRVLERTVALAKQTNAFDYRKLPKTLRVAIDSSPLEGTGRVEDTDNLLAHAARKVVRCAAHLLGWPEETVCQHAGIPVLQGTSVKAALDIDWNDAGDKADALHTLVQQLDALHAWIERRLPDEMAAPPLQQQLETLNQIRTQDLEPDPLGGGVRIRQGVAADRRVSVHDQAMRHGRKSKSKRFNGYKRHIAADVDSGLILACATTPANRPEEDAMPALQDDLERQALTVDHLLIDRGCINGTLVDEVLRRRGKIVCKPWTSHNGALFPKSAFTLISATAPSRAPMARCSRSRSARGSRSIPRSVIPARYAVSARLRSTAAAAPLRSPRMRRCSSACAHRYRARPAAALRERTTIEHKLAHISQRQGNRARYVGIRKNTFDLRRASAIQNLETLHRAEIESRKVA